MKSLASGEDRPLLHGGCSDGELEAAIIHAINLKPERHDFLHAPQKILRFMSMTGDEGLVDQGDSRVHTGKKTITLFQWNRSSAYEKEA